MSSNIKIQRICQHCGKEFIAKTTVTKYCSHTCASRAYKARKRTEKVKKSNKETSRVKTQTIDSLNAKEILSVKEAAVLLGVSVHTTYRLINKGTLKAVNLSERLTRIKRSELNTLLTPVKPNPNKDVIEYDIDDCYSLPEIMDKYGISRPTLQQRIIREQIPKLKKGKFVYVPKVLIDKIFNPISD